MVPVLQWIAAAWTRRQAIVQTAETAVELVQELDKVIHPADAANPLPFVEVERIAAQRDAATAFKVDAAPTSQGCTQPPPGWWCSRSKDHEGPCAARRLEPLPQLAAKKHPLPPRPPPRKVDPT
jgi:hypothetical protein